MLDQAFLATVVDLLGPRLESPSAVKAKREPDFVSRWTADGQVKTLTVSPSPTLCWRKFRYYTYHASSETTSW